MAGRRITFSEQDNGGPSRASHSPSASLRRRQSWTDSIPRIPSLLGPNRTKAHSLLERKSGRRTPAPPPETSPTLIEPIMAHCDEADEFIDFLTPYIEEGDTILHLGRRDEPITIELGMRVPRGHVTSIDAGDRDIKFLTESSRAANVHNHLTFLAVQDLRALPFLNDTFDIVYASDLMIHLPPKFDHKFVIKVLAEMKRVTRPGGIIASRDIAEHHFFPNHDLHDLVTRTLFKASSLSGWYGPLMPQFYSKVGLSRAISCSTSSPHGTASGNPEWAKDLVKLLAEGTELRAGWLAAGVYEPIIDLIRTKLTKWGSLAQSWHVNLYTEITAEKEIPAEPLERISSKSSTSRPSSTNPEGDSGPSGSSGSSYDPNEEAIETDDEDDEDDEDAEVGLALDLRVRRVAASSLRRMASIDSVLLDHFPASDPVIPERPVSGPSVSSSQASSSLISSSASDQPASGLRPMASNPLIPEHPVSRFSVSSSEADSSLISSPASDQPASGLRPMASNPLIPEHPVSRFSVSSSEADSSLISSPASDQPASDSPVSEPLLSNGLDSNPPASDPPVPDPPVPDPPVLDSLVSGNPVSDQPASDPQVSAPPVSAPPVSAPPVPDSLVSDNPISDQPVSNQPVSDSPVLDQPASDQPIPDALVSSPPVSDPPVSDSPVSNQPAPGQPAPGQPDSGQPASGQPLSNPPVSNEPVSGPPGSKGLVSFPPPPGSDPPVSDPPPSDGQQEGSPRAKKSK